VRAVTALASAEAGMLVRNRMAAFNGLALPLGFGALLLLTGGPPAGGSGALAALQLIAVLLFTLYSVATTRSLRGANSASSSAGGHRQHPLLPY